MKYSILIANFNNGKHFADCWNSLLAQSYTNWEAIIVDDCSTDNSVEMIRKIVNGDDRVKFFQNDTNKGCGFTKRRCVEFASGEICGFLDPDDALEKDALMIMNEVFIQNPSIVLAYSKHYKCDENLKPLKFQKIFKSVNTRDLYYFNFGALVSHFSVFKSEAYKNTDGIDAYMLRAVDQDLYLKLFEQGETVFVDDFLYKYRLHSYGISTGSNDENVTKANYWHWYAINSAAKRRGVIVENLFLDKFVNKSSYNYLEKNYNLILNSSSFKLVQKLSKIKNIFIKSGK